MRSPTHYISAGFCAVSLLAASGQNSTMHLATFSDVRGQQFPSGWGVREGLGTRPVKSTDPWRVVTKDRNAVLVGHSEGDAITIGKEVKYDLLRYRVLSWRWRVEQLPQGGDESSKDTNDSAAGVYVLFYGGLQSIKYVWSSTLAIGTTTTSPSWALSKIIVLRSGSEGIHTWQHEKRDVLQDFRRLFGTKEANPQAVGIAFLTDSDNTHSIAEAWYDDVTASTP